LGFICEKAAFVVHRKANRSEQAVTRELSKVLSIVIVFVAKNNRLRGRNKKRRQKLEAKIDKKRIIKENQRTFLPLQFPKKKIRQIQWTITKQGYCF
jgi:hypothetical protein